MAFHWAEREQVLHCAGDMMQMMQQLLPLFIERYPPPPPSAIPPTHPPAAASAASLLAHRGPCGQHSKIGFAFCFKHSPRKALAGLVARVGSSCAVAAAVLHTQCHA